MVMAPHFLIFNILTFILLNPSLSVHLHDFSLLEFEPDSFFHGDYTPPSPPPPLSPPHPPSLSCEYDLNGIGTLETICKLNSSLIFQDDDVYIEAAGSVHLLPGVILSCVGLGCSITFNVTGEFVLSQNAAVLAASVYVTASNATFFYGSLVNVTGLAGDPPPQTSGTPEGLQGSGGGHGGRGASCVVDNMKLPDDVWGGDAYSWSSLEEPWSYGSQGGSTTKEENFGGKGGGRIWFDVLNEIEVDGGLLADGGDGGIKGGGGSGGSIFVKAHRM